MNQEVRTHGFTLAELLAVVVIVGLLAILAVGYYKKSVEQSRFSEGLIAASAVVEGLNQAYLDDIAEGIAPSAAAKSRKIKALPAAMANSGPCSSASDSCVATKHFEVAVESSGSVVRAYRGKATDYKYYLEMHTSYASSSKNKVACGGSATAKTFCESMGYTNCTSNLCVKP